MDRADRLPTRRAGRAVANCRRRNKPEHSLTDSASVDSSDVDSSPWSEDQEPREPFAVRRPPWAEPEPRARSYFSYRLFLGTGAKQFQEYWTQHHDMPRFFVDKNLRIADDGGLSDIENLLYTSQYFHAANTLVCGLVNIAMIYCTDWVAITTRSSHEALSGKFLLSKLIVVKVDSLIGTSLSQQHLGEMYLAVPIMEVACLTLLLAQITVYAIISLLGPSVFKSHGEMVRWSYCENLFWGVYPQLCCFSAMQLLHFVTPEIAGSHFYHTVLHARQRWEKAKKLGPQVSALMAPVYFVISRGIYAIIGFDAFLVKYRLAIGDIDRYDMDIHHCLAAAVFLLQVMGIVNLHWCLRERLFLFIFGGQDGQIDEDEETLVDVWSALVTKHIYARFGFWKGSVVMLGFDAYDFQKLALEDDEQKMRQETGTTYPSWLARVTASLSPRGA